MRATTRRTSHELLLPRVWRGHRPLLSLRQTDGGFWNSRGERQITRLKKLTMTEGTGGSKLCRGWMNDVTTKAKATLMRCSMQSSLYNTFLSARKSSTAQHTLSDPVRKIPSSPANTPTTPLVCLLCVCMPWPLHHITEQEEATPTQLQLRIHARVQLQPQIHPQPQPMCWLIWGGSHSMASSMSERRADQG